ncbi:MAG TPA: hypothetical protein VGJ95_15585 [Pseudonocardiaceae bacterium]|jgi:hypothetical protein
MTVAVEMTFRGATLEQYDTVVDKMGYERQGEGHQDGLFHWVAQTPEGLRIVDVWDSPEAFQAFADSTLGPISAEVGVPAPAVTITPIHNYLYGPRFAR